MAYSRGTSTNILVGAAALFTYEAGELTDNALKSAGVDVATTSAREILSNDSNKTSYRNVGYTTTGLELAFQPTFGEVAVDQVLDAAKLYKSGMKVELKTSFAEATLENLLFSIAGKSADLASVSSTSTTSPYKGQHVLNMSAGEIGECPVERGLIAVGPGSGDCAVGSSIERVYVAYRALSITNVSVMSKRDAPTEFAVTFRLLPNDTGSYGKIVDRTIAAV